MEGITILDTITIAQTALGWSWGGLVFAILVVISLTIYTISLSKGTSALIPIAAFLISLCFSGLSAYYFGTAVELPDIVQHKVLIDESVNLLDFYEKYDIVEQEGKIFTIQEKEVINND